MESLGKLKHGGTQPTVEKPKDEEEANLILAVKSTPSLNQAFIKRVSKA